MICYFFNVYRCVSKMKLKYQIINIQNVYKIAEFLTEISYKINTFFFFNQRILFILLRILHLQ